jgi:hypothetical protein
MTGLLRSVALRGRLLCALLTARAKAVAVPMDRVLARGDYGSARFSAGRTVRLRRVRLPLGVFAPTSASGLSRCQRQGPPRLDHVADQPSAGRRLVALPGPLPVTLPSVVPPDGDRLRMMAAHGPNA